MPTPRPPAFMQGVTATTADPCAPAENPGARIRAVAWAQAATEPALPPTPKGARPPPPIIAGPAPQARPAALGSASLAKGADAPAPPVTSASPVPTGRPAEAFEPLPSAHPAPFPSPALPPGAPVAPAAVHAVAPPPAPAAPAPSPRELSPKVELALQALRAQGERLAEQARADALELGLLVARKIIDREVSTNVEVLFSLVKSALKRLGETRGVVVRLCPADQLRLQSHSETPYTLGKVELVADDSLSPGDVVVESQDEAVDGRVSTRLDELRRELEQAFKDAEG